MVRTSRQRPDGDNKGISLPGNERDCRPLVGSRGDIENLTFALNPASRRFSRPPPAGCQN